MRLLYQVVYHHLSIVRQSLEGMTAPMERGLKRIGLRDARLIDLIKE